jgi:hypothetical protein
MTEISLVRLTLLRVAYALLAFGLGSTVWPSIVDPSTTWPLKSGVVFAMLGALSLLSILGLRYPLQLLPLLLFEMGWKVIWLLRMAWPLWSTHQMDAVTTQTLHDVLPIVLFPLLIPWSYVVKHYVRKSGDPWRHQLAPMPSAL